MSHSNSLAEARYRNFDYLRLFLAVEVVAGHLWAGMLRPGELWMPIPPVAAFVGLSGFLIPQSLERSRDLWHFAWKRVLRTIPALIPLLIAITVVLGFDRTVGAVTQYVTAGYYGQFLGVTLPLWSLIVEDGLYACIALLFMFGAHRHSVATIPMLGALILGGAFVKDEMTVYRLFSTSIAFFAGNLVCILHPHLCKSSWVWPALGLAASRMEWLGFMGPLGFPFQIGCVIVLAMTLPQGKWRIPDISYATYIWHAPIMLALLARGGMTRDSAWVLATSGLTLLVSLLSWYLVEKKALRLKDWQLSDPSTARTQVLPSAVTHSL